MELTSKKVKHIFSGEGVITKATDTKIYVDFNGNVEIFKFPDAFINRSLSLIPIELNNFLLSELGLPPTPPPPPQGIIKLAMPRVVAANTNADFLNSELGLHYKQYMKSGYHLSSSTLIWMIRIDGKIRQDWRNRWIDNDTIEEAFLGNRGTRDLYVGSYKTRIVCEIKEGLFGRKYRVHGIFRIASQSDGSSIHIWKRDKTIKFS